MVSKIVHHLPDVPGNVLEIGSGPGFLADYIPDLVTSDIFTLPGVRCVLDGSALPFATGSLRGIVMTNVLHFPRTADILRRGGPLPAPQRSRGSNRALGVPLVASDLSAFSPRTILT